MAARNIPSTSTPEYKTFQQNMRRIILHVQEQESSIRISLFEKGYINDSLLDVNPYGTLTRQQHASNLVISLLRRIECNTSVFHGFIEILNREPSGNEIAQVLQQSYELEHQQQCEPNVQQVQQPPVVDSAESLSNGFLCPYCRRCTLEEFTSEKGCPKKPLEDFPFLDARNLLPGEKEKLEIQLRCATKKIITKFSAFVGKLRCSLDERFVPLGDIKFAILNLVPFRTNNAGETVLDHSVCEEIRAAKLCSDVFPLLQKYISFFNYTIIEDLVAKFGSDDDKTKWDEYVLELNTFCKRNVFEVPPQVFSTGLPPTAKVFFVKCNAEHMPVTLETVLEIKEKIANTFNLTFEALRLCSISEGCVELRFSVSASVADRIFPISDDQRTALGKIGIQVFTENEEIPKPDGKKMSSQNIPVPTNERGQKWDIDYTLDTNDTAGDNDGVFNISKISQFDTSKPMAIGRSFPTWSTRNGKYSYGASGKRKVLLITSDLTTQDDDVEQRRPGGELKDDERQKLEHQGVSRDCHHDDLSIMKARHGLNKESSIAEVLRDDGSLTHEQVTTTITQLLNDTETGGVLLHYIGPGKKGTGDWCFSDGFISFRGIMHLYLQNAYFKGRVLTIVSDCSYSGCWVKEAMSFMDEHGVGPCGHTAKEKGILVKVFASCLANEIPAELAFSIHCAKNDKNTGTVSYLLDKKIHDGQHTSGLDFTAVQCKSKIDEPCTMTPGSTWHRRSVESRVYLVRGKDKGRPAWYYVLVVDDEETIREFFGKVKAEFFNVADYSQVLKTGWGQDPPEETKKQIREQYYVNYDYQPPSQSIKKDID